MFTWRLFTQVLCFRFSIGAVQAIEAHVVHERRSDVQAQHWLRESRLSPDVTIPMRIALTQTNLDQGHEVLMDVSNPSSPSYGKHLSAEEVVELFAPANETFAKVTQWLVSEGIDYTRLRLSANKQWIKFDASAHEVQNLLHTELYKYQHRITLERSIAVEQYSVPFHLQKHIDYILPGILLRSMKKHTPSHGTTISNSPELEEVTTKRSALGQFSNCTKGMTPQCIAAIYNITESHTSFPGNNLAFYETDDDVYNQTDFDLYTAHYYPRIPQGFAPTFIRVDNTSQKYNPKKAGDDETSLDVQVSLPIIYPQGFEIFQTPPSTDYKIVQFNVWLDAIDGSYCNYTAYNITGDSPGIDPVYPNKQYPKMEQCGVYKPPKVLSSSWGSAEATYPLNYMKRQCSEYMKLGLQGTSLVFITGDYGVQAAYANTAVGLESCLNKADTIFAPIFPGTCPYITSVGATGFAKGSDVLDPANEHALSLTGGGFSNVWASPKYQKSAVHTYLTDHAPGHPSYSTENNQNIGAGGGIFNRNGRGIPDISALGNDFVGYAYGRRSFDEGTSMSAPLWAAIITRINEARLAMHKSTVGFINPALYHNPNLLRDISKGHNQGCNYTGIGFNATKGWDPVTGLGSPNFTALIEYFTSL